MIGRTAGSTSPALEFDASMKTRANSRNASSSFSASDLMVFSSVKFEFQLHHLRTIARAFVRVNKISLALQYLLDSSALHREGPEADARY
jgi:hypothetical protein